MSDGGTAFLIQHLPREIEALEQQKESLVAQANYVAGQIAAKRQILAALTAPSTEPPEEPIPDA